MIVLTLLNAATAKLVTNALDSKSRIIAHSSTAGFASAIDHERADVAVVDPSVDCNEAAASRLSTHPLVRALGRASAPPFIVYLSDGRASLPLRAALIRLRPAMVAARGIDDQADRVRTMVERAIASRTPEDLITRLAERLTNVRARLADALASVIRCPLDFGSVQALAAAAGISSRALTRELKEAALASPRDWMAAGRVVRAHWELRDPALRIRHVVAIMGYSSEEPLANDVASVTHGTPSELRRMSQSELIAIVARRLAPTPLQLVDRVAPPADSIVRLADMPVSATA